MAADTASCLTGEGVMTGETIGFFSLFPAAFFALPVFQPDHWKWAKSEGSDMATFCHADA